MQFEKHYISNVAVLARYIRDILWHIHRNACCGINRGVKCSAYFSETSRGRGKIIVLPVALVLGKVIGSLFHWIYFCKVGGSI